MVRAQIEAAITGIVQSQALICILASRTPCFGRLYDALPEESRVARVKLVVPQGHPSDTDLVIHLAGTGDHGFERRLHLGFPLIKQVLFRRDTLGAVHRCSDLGGCLIGVTKGMTQGEPYWLIFAGIATCAEINQR